MYLLSLLKLRVVVRLDGVSFHSHVTYEPLSQQVTIDLHQHRAPYVASAAKGFDIGDVNFALI